MLELERPKTRKARGFLMNNTPQIFIHLGNLLTDEVKTKLDEILISFKANYDWCGSRSDNSGKYNGNYEYERIFADIYDYIQARILHTCGCGDPDSVTVAVDKYLHIVQKRHETGTPESKIQAEKDLLENAFGLRVTSVLDDPLLLFMVYNLDEVGLTEHGTSIRCAWLTELGKQVLFVLDLFVRAMEMKDEDRRHGN